MTIPLALTMGDPAGIGPEIVVKVAAELDAATPVLVYGDAPILARTVAALGLDLAVEVVDGPADVRARAGVVHVRQGPRLPSDLLPGVVSAHAGDAAYGYVVAAASDAMTGTVSGIVTAPISKEALRLAGHAYPGHTEILAELSGATDYSMMMASEELTVVLVTIHVPLRDVPDLVDEASVLRIVRLADRTLSRPGRAARIGVAGLNPHAGEQGLMGREEIEAIAPAVARAAAEGIDVRGPLPPDTIFMRARAGDFDVVVAQHHDQGLIPFKYLGLDTGVNVTIGLPFVRTSVDHGTAFDIVGTGRAAHASLRLAVDQALRLVG